MGPRLFTETRFGFIPAVERLTQVLALSILGSCQVPELERKPFAFAEQGAFSLSLRPAVLTEYGIKGSFTSMDFATGDEIVSEDSGEIVGRFGLALRADWWLSPDWIVSCGADYRTYDVKNLTPSEELDITIDQIDSLQYYLATRHLFRALDSTARLRPFGQVTLSYLPSVDVSFAVDLSAFGSSNLEIDATGDGYWVGGLSTGLVLQLTDRWLVETGLLYEIPLSNLDVDLGFDIAGNSVPFDAELKPQGLVGFVGATWAP